MKLTLFLIVFLTCYFSATAQHDFLYERTSLDTLRLYEDSINSKSLGFVKTKVAKDYFPTAEGNHEYFPLSYIRTNDTFYPELHISYYYSDDDSTLLSTAYNWNIMKYVKNLKLDGDKFEKETSRKKEYLAQYNSVKAELIAKYGEPTTTEEPKNKAGYFYKLTWNNQENDILVLLKFSKELKHLPGDMKIGSFSIRVKVDYK